MIYDAIMNDLEFWIRDAAIQVYTLLSPYIFPIIIGIIISLIARKILKEFSYSYFRICGDSKRKSRKKAKKIAEVYDLICTAKDINDLTRKD